jgi:hypothetical protein
VILKALSGFEINSIREPTDSVERRRVKNKSRDYPLIRVDCRIIATRQVLTASRAALLRVASFASPFDPLQNSRPTGLQSAHPVIGNFFCLHSARDLGVFMER